jgi:thiamine biosynthesis lipoprotein
MKRSATFQTTPFGWSVFFGPLYGLALVSCLIFGGCNPAERKAEEALLTAQQDRSFAAVKTADGRYKVWFTAETMGSTYNITYLARTDRSLQPQIDSFLLEFNACLSTYDSSSMLSQWNRSTSGISSSGNCSVWFTDLVQLSQQVHRQSQGAFDPTVVPLLRYWGFFREDPFAGQRQPDSAQIRQLLQHVGLDKHVLITAPSAQKAAMTGEGVSKRLPAVEMDFNAIAPGYAADQIAAILQGQGMTDYLVEVGGEVRAAGLNDRGKPWTLAIEKPVENSREAQILVGVANAGLATSGNYRKFWERDGVRYSHTLNPETGFPERSNLLSVSVLAPTAAQADAYATACMVLGLDRGLRLLEELPEIEGYFIYLDAANAMATAQTSGFGQKTALP